MFIAENVRPEIQSALGDTEQRIVRAISALHLPSTEGLCHHINFSIATGLSRRLQLPVVRYRDGDNLAQSGLSPRIVYVSEGHLSVAEDMETAHSFALLVGVASQVILVDGANDQRDPQVPFYIAAIGKGRRRDLKDHGRYAKNSEEMGRSLQSAAQFVPRLLKGLLETKRISEVEYKATLNQFMYEAQVGMGFLIAYNRKWLSYFMTAVGVDYPSVHRVQRKHFPVEQYFGDPYLTSKVKKWNLLADQLIPDENIPIVR